MEFRENTTRGIIVSWTRHAYAIRSDKVVMDAWKSIMTPSGRLRVKQTHSLFHETYKADRTRAELGVAYAKAYGEVCPAYTSFMTVNDYKRAGLAMPATPLDNSDTDPLQSRLQVDYGLLWAETFAVL